VGGTNLTTVTTNANRGFTLISSSNTIQTDNSNATIQGKITGTGGFNKIGGLILTLTGANDYAGDTNVNNGTLRVNNTSGSGTGTGTVSIASAATLAGTGSVAGPIVLNSGGHIAAGIGGGNAALTIPALDLNAGAFIDATLGAASAADVLNVTTTNGLNLFGGTLSVSAVSNPVGQTFTVVDYAGTLGGDLLNVTVNNLTGYENAVVTNDATNSRIQVAVSGAVIDRTWIDDDGGNWAAAEGASWSTGSQANGTGSIARFGVTSPTNPSQTVTISDFTKVVGTLILDNAASSYTIASSNTTMRLTTAVYSGNAAINVLNGSHTITAPMTYTSLTDVNVTGTNQLKVGSTTNNGGVNKIGTGVLLISTADWGGLGDVNINEGTLRYENNSTGLSNAGKVTIGPNGIMDQNATLAVPVNDTIGALAGSGQLINIGNMTIQGVNTTPVEFSGNATMNASPPTTRTLTKNGAGVQILSGANEYATAVVGGGTLVANSQTGSATGLGTVAVNNTATLAGNGRAGGGLTTVNSGGNLTPGYNGIGTLTLLGGLTLNSGARLNFELDTVAGNDVSDKIIVSAASGLTIAASTTTTLNLANAGAMTAGTYTLIDYDTAFTGALTSIVLGTQPAGFTYSLVNNAGATTIDLVVAALLQGDYNNNGVVDAADYVLWRKNPTLYGGNPAGYNTWRANFGATAGSGSSLGSGSAVPEPASLVFALIAAAGFATTRRRSR
jgi:autotransporter-associated beta strand protein